MTSLNNSIKIGLLVAVLIGISLVGTASAADPVNLKIDKSAQSGVSVLNPFTLKTVQTKAEPESLVLMQSLFSNNQEPIRREYTLSDGTTVYVRGRQVIIPYKPTLRSPCTCL